MIREQNLKIIAAISDNKIIGKNGKLPWHIPADMQRFRDLTIPHPIIMGRVTYESLPEKFRPLPERPNIILTTNPRYTTDNKIFVAHSIDEAIQEASGLGEMVFIAGGARIYEAFMPHVGFMHLTRVHVTINSGDLTRFPEYDSTEWQEIYREYHSTFSFVDYERLNQ